MNPYLDLDYGPLDPKVEAQEQNSLGADGVIPVQSKTNMQSPPLLNDNCLELDFSGSKLFPYASYTAAAQCLSHREQRYREQSKTNQAVQQLSAVDREARVLRYREQRKNRKFEKTIRYASRKYAETRPRIKGRFAKRSDTEMDVEVEHRSLYAGFGVVPSF